MTIPDPNELELELDSLLGHVCCYSDDEVRDLIRRFQAVAHDDAVRAMRNPHAWDTKNPYEKDLDPKLETKVQKWVCLLGTPCTPNDRHYATDCGWKEV